MNFEVLVATNNKHKLQEIRQILSPFHVTVYGMNDLNITPPEVIENGNSYYENALIKAKSLQKLTKFPIIADDSGLEIDALDGAPGLHSARYAESFGGHDKAIENILDEIKNRTRSARFICDIVVLNIEDKPLKFESIIEGYISEKPMGSTGFGYDPIFIEKTLNKTYAEMSQEEKNKVSHRGKALQKLLTYFKVNNLVY